MARSDSRPGRQQHGALSQSADDGVARPGGSASEQRTAGRRRFLAELAAVAAAPAVLGCTQAEMELAAEAKAAAAAKATPASQATSAVKSPQATPAAAALPAIQLGSYRISRLIAGSNPINGFSYLGRHVDRHMKDYFTPEQTVTFLQKCEREGITAHQFSARLKTDYLRMAREQGVKLHFIALHPGNKEIQSEIQTTQPIGMVHHGGVTDELFGKGKSPQVHDFVKAVHDCGIMAGVSSHCPDNVKRIADEGWEVDFFMTCFYFLSREKTPGAEEKAPAVPTLEVSHAFYKDDPLAMTEVIRQVQQPCLAFKILAAGRQCKNDATVREAFKFAFSRIKPTDGVIVGMYPRFSDEVQANARHAREFGQITPSPRVAQGARTS
jgi:hypothetical protein